MRRVFTASGIGTFLLGVALALGFTMSAQTISRAMVRMRQANTISVKGFAAETIESDFATWGVFQITPVHSTEVSGEGVYDTSTIKKRVTAVVTLQFLTGKPEG